MLVAKTFFKIVKANLWTFIIYLVVFFGMIILITSNNKSTGDVDFTSTKVDMAVKDLDNSEISRGLIEYLDKTQTLVDVEDNEEAVQDAMYFREIVYYLVIPEGFGYSMLNGGEVSLSSTKLPDSTSGIFVDMAVEEFLNTYKAYLASGLNASDALDATMKNLEITTPVEMLVDDGRVSDTMEFTYYYRYMSYALIAIMSTILGNIMVSFNKKEVFTRTKCSSMTLRSRNFQMAFCSVILAFVILAMLIVVSMFMFGDEIKNSGMLSRLIINSSAYTLVTVAISYMVGCLCTSANQISGISVTLSLALSFLSGTFVSLEYLSSAVLKAAKFIPTYWYIVNCQLIGTTTHMGTELNRTFLTNVGIQILFAATIFAVALVYSRRKNARA